MSFTIKGLFRIMRNIGTSEATLYYKPGSWIIEAIDPGHTVLVRAEDLFSEIVEGEPYSSKAVYVVDVDKVWEAVAKLRKNERAVLLVKGTQVYLGDSSRIPVGELRRDVEPLPEIKIEYVDSVIVGRPDLFKAFVKSIPSTSLIIGINRDGQAFAGFFCEQCVGKYYTFDGAYIKPGLMTTEFREPSITIVDYEHLDNTMPLEFVRGKNCSMSLELARKPLHPLRIMYTCGTVNVYVYIAPRGTEEEYGSDLISEILENSPRYWWLEPDDSYLAVGDDIYKLLSFMGSENLDLDTEQRVIYSLCCGNLELYSIALYAIATRGASSKNPRHRYYSGSFPSIHAYEWTKYINKALPIIQVKGDELYFFDQKIGEAEKEKPESVKAYENVSGLEAVSTVHDVPLSDWLELLRAMRKNRVERCDQVVVNSNGDVYYKKFSRWEKIAHIDSLRIGLPSSYTTLTRHAVEAIVAMKPDTSKVWLAGSAENPVTMIQNEYMTIILAPATITDEDKKEIGIAVEKVQPPVVEIKKPREEEKPTLTPREEREAPQETRGPRAEIPKTAEQAFKETLERLGLDYEKLRVVLPETEPLLEAAKKGGMSLGEAAEKLARVIAEALDAYGVEYKKPVPKKPPAVETQVLRPVEEKPKVPLPPDEYVLKWTRALPDKYKDAAKKLCLGEAIRLVDRVPDPFTGLEITIPQKIAVYQCAPLRTRLVICYDDLCFKTDQRSANEVIKAYWASKSLSPYNPDVTITEKARWGRKIYYIDPVNNTAVYVSSKLLEWWRKVEEALGRA